MSMKTLERGKVAACRGIVKGGCVCGWIAVGMVA